MPRTPCLRLAAALLVAGALFPSGSSAQEAGRWNVTAFAGGFFGSRTFTGPTLNVTMATVPTYGLRLGYGVTKAFSVEAGWAHASSRLVPTDAATGAPAGPEEPVAVNTYELEALYWFGREPVRGYLGLGGGVMNLAPSVVTLSGSSSTEFAANFAVGGTFRLGPAVSFRADARYRWRGGRSRVGEVVCYDTCTVFTTNIFSSAEVTGGITYRF